MTLHYDSEIRIHKVPMGDFGNNGYLLVCPETNQSIIIDTPGEPEKLLNVARGTAVKAILITHTHGDHLIGFEEIRARTGAPVGVHSTEAENLPSPPDLLLSDGEMVTAGSVAVSILHTPGHTPGAVCFLSGKHLFSGDTLFPGGPGRTGSPENLRQEIESITTRLFILPGITNVYPGHGENTTIARAQEEYKIFADRSHPPNLCGDVEWLNS